MLLIAYDISYIYEVEFAILYDLNKSNNPEISYWQHDTFDLKSMKDNEYKTEFGFEKEHPYNLVNSLQLNEEKISYNRFH